MLFRWKIQVKNEKNIYEFALIQWYDFKYQTKNRLFKYECPHLKSIEMFTLVAIDSIVEPVHIISRFGKENEYLVNTFLF
jgi:hypothetical protein